MSVLKRKKNIMCILEILEKQIPPKKGQLSETPNKQVIGVHPNRVFEYTEHKHNTLILLAI